MPAIITHHIFGEDAATLLPDGLLDGQEDLIAFLRGNQGTDPFWARVRTYPKRAQTCHRFATSMHESHMVEALMALGRSVGNLREEDKSIGRAFTLGMAAHYLLDSVAHPLVYAQQEGIIEADPSLSNARDEIHAIIESDLDSWMLWEKRKATVLDTPCTRMLASTERIDFVTGSMLSQVAWEVFGLNVGAAEYGLALRDYALIYKAIDPPAQRTRQVLSTLERLGRPHSRLESQAHRIITENECPLANLDHHLWRNPVNGEASTASFADLFHDALMAWPTFSLRLIQGDEQRLAAMIDGINYYGAVS